MNIPCAININCQCLDSNPVVGFSAEPPDEKFFVGRGFTGVTPPIGDGWGTMTCQTITQSTTSQQAADLFAISQGVECVVATFTNPNGNPVASFQNTQQVATFTCPDGLPFNYTVPAGAFTSATSQLDANTQALTYAQQQATARAICLSNLAVSVSCPGASYSQPITATGAFLAVPPFTDAWSVSSGSLPPGLSLSATSIAGGTISIVGTTTTVGLYPFAITIVDPQGDTMTKMYSISVAGITNATTLPQPTKTFFYSQALVVSGLVSPLFSLTSGILPPGLSLSSGGVISGTPTAIGSQTFTVTVTDTASGVSCATPITMTVNGNCAPPSEILPEATLNTNTYVGIAYDSVDNINLVMAPHSGVNHLYTLTAANAFTGVSASNVQVEQPVGCYFTAGALFYVISPHNGGTAVTLRPSTLAQVGADGTGGTFNGTVLDAQYCSLNSLVYISCAGGIKVHNPALASGSWQVASVSAPGVQNYMSGRVSFDLTNKLLFIGVNNRLGGSAGYIYCYSIAATLPSLSFTIAVPAGGSGSLISSAIFCPDNNCLYASYQKIGTGAGYFIGVFNASTHALITEIQVTDGSTLSVYNDVNYSLNGVYNPSSKLMFFAFNQKIQIICTIANYLLTPISATTQNIVYSTANNQVYFIDNSGASSILKSYG